MRVSDSIGRKIKAYRRAAHLSQKELGKRCGMSQQMVTQYENDMRNPKVETLKRFADALNIPVSAPQPTEFEKATDFIDVLSALRLIMDYLGIDTFKISESELDSAAMDVFRYIVFRYQIPDSGPLKELQKQILLRTVEI